MPIRLLLALCLVPCLAAQSHSQTLIGAGATFPYPLYQKWFESYHQQHPEVSFDYRAIGSEAGVRDLKAGNVDFAASDMPLPDSLLAGLGIPVLQIPAALGAVVPIYHLDGVSEDVRFTAAILSGIFLGTITKWNDPAIRAVNRGLGLPNRPISVVHRADGSGTTFILADYLSKTSPEWKAKIPTGTTLTWPVGSGAEGNQGVAQKVRRTPDSIGYVEFIYALQNRLSYGIVQNAAGHWMRAGLDSLAAAAKTAAVDGSDLRVSITNAPGEAAYPIASFSFLVVPQALQHPEKSGALRDFLHWLLTSGQRQAASLGFGALPPEIVSKAQAAVDTLH